MSSSRHLSRISAFQSLFEWDFHAGQQSLEEVIKNNANQFSASAGDQAFIFTLAKGTVEHIAEIDGLIAENAPEWPIDQIPPVDRNVLRLGVFELKFVKDVPPKVAINEAVELAKSFGGETAARFVNGVLGTIYKKLFPDNSTLEKQV